MKSEKNPLLGEKIDGLGGKVALLARFRWGSRYRAENPETRCLNLPDVLSATQKYCSMKREKKQEKK